MTPHEPGRGRRRRAVVRRHDRDLDRHGRARRLVRLDRHRQPAVGRGDRGATSPTRASTRCSAAPTTGSRSAASSSRTAQGIAVDGGIPPHRRVELRLRHRPLARSSPPGTSRSSTARWCGWRRACPTCGSRSSPATRSHFTDGWHVQGLKGTGSYDYNVAGRVRARRTARTRCSPATPHRGAAPTLRMGLMPITAAGHAGWALGVAKSMLDDVERAGRHQGAHGRHGDARPPPDVPARLRPPPRDVAGGPAARARHVRRGRGGRRRRRRADARRCAPTCASPPCTPPTASRDVGEWAHLAAGTTAIREGSRLERAFRDLYTGTQHAFISEKVADRRRPGAPRASSRTSAACEPGG